MENIMALLKTDNFLVILSVFVLLLIMGFLILLVMNIKLKNKYKKFIQKLGNGKKITSEKQAIKNKIGYVSKNRDQEALILSASIMENTVLPSLSMIAKGGVITKGAEKKFTDKQVKDMSIKCREIGQNVGDLSGGNKQKVVFGKWLGNESEIYILDCPTRGIDIGVKAFMYQLMYRLKKEGKSILMISEELPELIGMSDRILIMKDGQIQDSFTRSEELNESVLIKKMV